MIASSYAARARTNPYIVPWSKPSENVKEWDRETVREIPELLSEV
jgi:hypothetical protein